MTEDQTKLNVSYCREQFPALKQDFVFMDNAGGSHTLKGVAERMSEYLLNWDVQHGASYLVSQIATSKVQESVERLRELIHAERVEEVIMGSSSTSLLRILSLCISHDWEEGDEIIITNSEHEANGSCWTDLEKKGIVIKYWEVNPESYELELEQLAALLSPRTKLVSVVHASNILGTINDIEGIAKKVHENGSLICVDGVAYAPHRRVDVQKWDVDFYVYSCYKTFGPHCGLMYGKYHLLEKMKGINHHFLEDQVPYKFQPGNLNYEMTYGMAGVCDYLTAISKDQSNEAIQPHQAYDFAFDLFAEYEEMLSKKLLTYLNGKEGIRIIGKNTADQEQRVATISFVSGNRDSREIVQAMDEFNIGIRFGDFYAKEIIKAEGLVEQNGVVRVSLVHYNTMEEVGRLIEAFEEIL